MDDQIDFTGDEFLDHDGSDSADGLTDDFQPPVDYDYGDAPDVNIADWVEIHGDLSLDLQDELPGTDEVSKGLTAGGGEAVADVFAQIDSARSIWNDSDATTDSETPLSDPLVVDHDMYNDLSFAGYDELYEVHGTPLEDMALWDPQDDPMSCAVATTSMMFHSIGVEHISESGIAEEFQELGIYDPATGTDTSHLADSLNRMCRELGIEAEAVAISGATVKDWAEMLGRGTRPQLFIDATELDPLGRALNDLGLIPGSPHAVQLIGIEDGPNGCTAIINDPGSPDGSGLQVPMDVLRDASQDFGHSGTCLTAKGSGQLSADSPDAQNAPVVGSTHPFIPGTEPIRMDAFGNMYRGDSLFPFN